ncbi:MAG: (deoxy)nucleoside triphosphate pyrophosphohydrolase [Bacteroidales bacterium]|nr:(deoxy)nucleoside triphosphate pyrophosphohydrolase [Bacteroidales bacterium]MCQ2253730.1 (deoxy)nucleoside triphosphate pyrophosphohydrolase [Bacteroidales bacterium]
MLKVTCGILRQGDKFFMAQRPANKQMGGFWEFPGGKVEEDEFESDCLHREWEEELGVSIMILKDYMPVTYDYSKFQIELSAFEISVVEGDLTLKEHTDSGYFSKEEIMKMDVTPADRIIVEKYL